MALTKKDLLTFFRTRAGRPLPVRDLLRLLKITGDDRRTLKHLLGELVTEGSIVRTRGSRFGLPERMDLETGTFQSNPAGFGFVLPEKKGKPEIMNYHVTAHRYGQPAHDVRSGGDKNAMEYVTVWRPCEHTGGSTGGFVSGDYAAAIAGQNGKCATDSLVACIFPGEWAGKTVDMVKSATGILCSAC